MAAVKNKNILVSLVFIENVSTKVLGKAKVNILIETKSWASCQIVIFFVTDDSSS